MRFLSLIGCMLGMVSCAGYHLGGTKPKDLLNVKSIAVPMFRNGTQHPKAEVLATSAVANALIQDGTYRMATTAKADAILEATLSSISYNAISGSRFDTLLPEELANTVLIDWKLLDARNPLKVLMTGISRGESKLFARNNLQTARNNALPEALELAGEALVSRLSNGY